MNDNLSRAHFLFEQGRYPMAAEEAGRQLALNPDDPFAHCLLALCLSKMKRHEEAIREAQTAVHLVPDLPNGYYVLGHVLDDVRRFREAEAAAREAIRLNPEDADYYALLSSLRFQQGHWADALGYAEQGLAQEPDNLSCGNLRGMALVQLGRRDEAGAAIQGTLAKDPENAVAHANQGWAMLHRGDHAGALTHFKEALRLKPDMEWARQGILEALRARNPVYRVLLNYFLWMSRLSREARYGVVFGIYVLPRLFHAFAGNNPALKPLADTLLALYLIFAFLTWTARPLFNLTLRLDPIGRYALTSRQVIASNWVGSSFLLAALGLVAWLVTRSDDAAIMAGGFAFVTAIVAATFTGSTVGVRRLIGTLTATVGLLLSGFVVYECLQANVWLGGPAAALIVGLLTFNIIAQARAGRRGPG